MRTGLAMWREKDDNDYMKCVKYNEVGGRVSTSRSKESWDEVLKRDLETGAFDT